MIISNYADKSNKVAALTETGQKNVEDTTWFTQKLLKALTGYPKSPKLAYVALWRNSEKGYWSPHKTHPALNDFLEFCKNPYIVFEDRLSNMYK
jgi:mannan endo-1,4-beta-mannosidase